MTDVELACQCGEVRGRVEGLSSLMNNHLVCYCDDCQAFADRLNARSQALDPYGGTEIMQVLPSQVTLSSGTEQLRCLRFSRKGATRWFTACCSTPVANTASAALPFAGVFAGFVNGVHPADSATGESVLGPVRYRVQGQYAIDPPPDLKMDKAFPRLMMARIATQMLLARIAGRHKPTPFYDGNGKPVSAPEILNP